MLRDAVENQSSFRRRLVCGRPGRIVAPRAPRAAIYGGRGVSSPTDAGLIAPPAAGLAVRRPVRPCRIPSLPRRRAGGAAQ